MQPKPVVAGSGLKLKGERINKLRAQPGLAALLFLRYRTVAGPACGAGCMIGTAGSAGDARLHITRAGRFVPVPCIEVLRSTDEEGLEGGGSQKGGDPLRRREIAAASSLPQSSKRPASCQRESRRAASDQVRFAGAGPVRRSSGAARQFQSSRQLRLYGESLTRPRITWGSALHRIVKRISNHEIGFAC